MTSSLTATPDLSKSAAIAGVFESWAAFQALILRNWWEETVRVFLNFFKERRSLSPVTRKLALPAKAASKRILSAPLKMSAPLKSKNFPKQ